MCPGCSLLIGTDIIISLSFLIVLFHTSPLVLQSNFCLSITPMMKVMGMS